MEETTELRKRTLAEGFDLVGIAAAGESRGANALRRWLESGMHGEMAYMNNTVDIRADVQKLLPGCKSVIAVGMSYHTDLPPSSSSTDPETVWISRYAWGRDYHRLLKKRLIRLGRWLADRHPGAGGTQPGGLANPWVYRRRAWSFLSGDGQQ